ncbi:MAG: hypothetical protein AAFS02_11380 [Pseudomonadota bacterium]
MSSSTSSSEPTGSGRGAFARVLFTVLIGMGLALGGVRLFALVVGVGSESLLGRVMQAQRALPQIAEEPNDLVMVFGSSMVRAGFSPREFDAALAEQGIDVTSFNFGFGGLNPLFQDYLSRRVVDELKARDRRLKLVVIEFNPFQTTVTRRNGATALEESYIAMLASDRELWQKTVDDPTSGIRMGLIRYLRDGISAEMITTFMWAEPFQPPDNRQRPQMSDEDRERLGEIGEYLNEVFDEDYPDYDGSDWYYPWRGGGTIKTERSEKTLEIFDEYYDLIAQDNRMEADRQSRIRTADIEELNFDDELVEAFIRIVENFKEVSDHVEVVMLPKNTDWIQNPPEAIERQAAAVARISEATGLPVRDYQVVEDVSNDMFSDTTHLNRYEGAVAFTEFLVSEYAEILR